MLPLSVKGEKPVSSNVLSTLAGGNVKPLSRITIYRRYGNIEVPETVNNVLSYEVSEDREFGASSLSITGSNREGLYSYGNTNSPINKLQVNNPPEDVRVSLELGSHTDVEYSGGYIKVEENKHSGTWISSVIDGRIDFHSWTSISWKTQYSTFSKGWTYSSSANIFIRYGNSSSVNDGTWTPWQKIKTVSGELSSTVTDYRLLSKQRFVQIRIDLYNAYKEHGSPSVSSVVLKKQMKTSGTDVLLNHPLYYYGNRIKVEECVITNDGTYEWFDKFSGFIDSVTPYHTKEGIYLKCTALDNMRLCLNSIIEKPDHNSDEDRKFESEKYKVTSFPLVKVDLDGIDFDEDGKVDVVVETEEEGFVYSIPYEPYEFRNNGPIRGYTNGPKSTTRGDHKLLPWVRRPDVKIYVDGELKRDGFDIDYEKGVVYFNEKPQKKDGSDNPSVRASFEWYDLETNLVEDVLGEIIALAIEEAGYAKPTKRREDGYDIWEAKDSSGELIHNMKIILEHSNPRITVPPIGFYLEDNKTYFQALEEVLRYIQVDYTLRATAEGYFVGEHLPQISPIEHPELIHSLNLVTSMDSPVSESDIFTKCIARGILPSTRNVAPRVTRRQDLARASDDIIFFSKSNDRGHNLRHLTDGDLKTNVGWMFVNREPSLPLELVKLTLEKPETLGAINILFGDGAGQPKDGWGNKWGEVNVYGFGVAVEVSPNDKDWYSLTEHDFTGASGEWVRIDKDSFLPDIKGLEVQYIKLIATSAPHFERGAKGFLSIFNKRYEEGQVWSLRQIQIFPDEEIRVDVGVEDLIESLSKNQSKEVADKIRASLTEVEKRVGTKTKVLPVDSSLQSEERVKARALDYLYETIRNLYTSNVEVVYSPYIRMGHTVKLENNFLLDGDVYHNLYYVDAVNSSMQGNKPSTQLSLVNWI